MVAIIFRDAMAKSGCYIDLKLDDEQYRKIEAASNELKEILKQEHMVNAAHALVVRVDKANNEAARLAFESLENHWENFSLVHPTEPTNLLAMMLLYVCDYLAENNEVIASILWLTIADSYLAILQDRKANILDGEIIARWANSYENLALSPYVRAPQINQFKYNIYNDTKLADENHSEISPQILSKFLTEISHKTATGLNEIRNSFIPAYQFQFEKLEVLWWFEAKYSTSIRKSYRELQPELNPLVMSFDLCDLMTTLPTTTSTTYFLAEAINTLSKSSFTANYTLRDILTAIRNDQIVKNTEPFSQIKFDSIIEGEFLNLRDLVIGALITDIPVEDLLQRSMIELTEITLPDLSKAIFRQEQAIRLSLSNDNE